MTNTEKFIEAAIEGGWDKAKTPGCLVTLEGEQYAVTGILLDPTAWQAVGKTLGWGKRSKYYMSEHLTRKYGKRYRYEMHIFIDHLADGLTIEEALAEIMK